MSLRRDVHTAFDEVAPALGGMPERVVKTVMAEHRTRQRKEKIVFQLRAPLSLVGVLLMIAMVAAVFVGGRLVADWNGAHLAPVGATYSQQVAALEARPLDLPAFQSRTACVSGPRSTAGAFGAGPLFAEASGFSWSTNWGHYFDESLYADHRIAGPIVVRARALFTPDQVVFIGPYAAGSVLGSEVLDGPPVVKRSELLLDSGKAVAGTDNNGTTHRFFWHFTAGVALGSSGSVGWQIDGAQFSEVFVVC